MFGLSFSEILMVLFLIIVFVKPEDLPKLMRKAGHIYGQFKQIYYEFIDKFEDLKK